MALSDAEYAINGRISKRDLIIFGVYEAQLYPKKDGIDTPRANILPPPLIPLVAFGVDQDPKSNV